MERVATQIPTNVSDHRAMTSPNAASVFSEVVGPYGSRSRGLGETQAGTAQEVSLVT